MSVKLLFGFTSLIRDNKRRQQFKYLLLVSFELFLGFPKGKCFKQQCSRDISYLRFCARSFSLDNTSFATIDAHAIVDFWRVVCRHVFPIYVAQSGAGVYPIWLTLFLHYYCAGKIWLTMYWIYHLMTGFLGFLCGFITSQFNELLCYYQQRMIKIFWSYKSLLN